MNSLAGFAGWRATRSYSTARSQPRSRVVVAALSMLAVDHLSFLTSADRFVQDYEIATRSPFEPQDPNIVIVGVTEPVMQNFPYRSPLDRSFLAKVLTALDSKKPRAIVLDYLFDQPTEKEKDDVLRNMLRAIKAPLVVSYFEAGSEVSADQTAYLNAFVPPRARAVANIGTDQTDTARWIVPDRKIANGQYLLSVPRRVAQIAGIDTPNEQVPIVWRADPGVNQSAFREVSACVLGFSAACRSAFIQTPTSRTRSS